MNIDASVEIILQKPLEGKQLTLTEIETLLSIRDTHLLERLFWTAREIREQYFRNKVFLYGFVYFSTYCRNNCSFCFYRCSNPESVRYRKSDEEIIELSSSLQDSGVHVIDLTMGEDPIIHNGGRYRRLIDIVQMVNDNVDIPIMLSPGAIPHNIFNKLREAGADWFACYQETHNRNLFKRLRPNQDYDFRLSQKMWAMESGLLAEEGIMVGVGECLHDRARSIELMKNLQVDQIRAMSFVPQNNTPMAHDTPSLFIDELVTLAVMRLVHPDKLIPASLDIEGINGLSSRLNAGANVVTSIIPPQQGLAGVAQHELDIDDGSRSVEQIENNLDDLGFSIAPLSDYVSLIQGWKDVKGNGATL
ncbi:MAG: methylornithine synthase PylB [Euryarchaeota archaeon]|nr:methylornithine synthase PylB [Euryarchaeota archaeon]